MLDAGELLWKLESEMKKEASFGQAHWHISVDKTNNARSDVDDSPASAARNFTSILARFKCHVKKSELLRSLLGGGEGRVRRASEGVDVELQLGLHENRTSLAEASFLNMKIVDFCISSVFTPITCSTESRRLHLNKVLSFC